jgi:gliding motility-associated-like protein
MIKDAYGNTYMKSQLVHAYASPIAKFDVIPTHVFVNDEAVRFINQSQKVDLNDYYVWDFGDGDTSHVEQTYHKYMSEGTFDPTLFAYSTNGCSDKFTLTPGILVEPAGVLRFATVFTPNKTGPIDIDKLPTGGDQLDQFFFPPIREKVLDYKLQIFNRWGTLIFQTTDINHPWNGYYKGKLCKQGVYVWYVEGKYANGKPFKKVGDVTLLQ